MSKVIETTAGVVLDANLAWAISVAATRINKGYLKKSIMNRENNTVEQISNSQLMAELVAQPHLITDEDRNLASEIRSHYQHLIMRHIAGELQSFLQLCLVLASKEDITVYSKDWPLLTSMPSTYASELERQERRVLIDELEQTSTPFGKIGEDVNGAFKVVSCAHTPKWNNYAVNVLQNNHLFYFFDHVSYPVGQTVNLQGRIKTHYKNSTTQLFGVTRIKD